MFREFAAWLQQTPASQTIQTVTWVVPTLQSIHILTLAVVFVSILIIVLRVLGAARTEEPLGDIVRRFAPVVGFGLIVLATTGAFLIVGEPIREFTALSFWLKMSLLVVAIASGEYFRRRLRAAPDTAPTDPAPSGLKFAAVATLLVWIGIIYMGRTIAYDVEVWGSLSFAADAATHP